MKKTIRKIGREFLCMTLIGMIALGCMGCIKLEEIPYSEVTVEDTLFADKFYYSQLDDGEKLVYKEIYQGIIEHEEKIYVHSSDAYKVNDILVSVIYDFGEIFWADGSCQTTAYEESMWNDAYAIIEPTYIYTREERVLKEQEIEAAVAQVVSSIPDEYTEYDKIKYVYEYLVNNVEYVEEAPDNQNIYSALIGKETVCAGYAKANQYLLNRLGIYCTYVVGTAAQEEEFESHAWNIVRCNGSYYYVDVTWADPINTERNAEIPLVIPYDYLCCSEKQMENTHRVDEQYAYPECVSDDLNYYRMNQMYYETVNRDELLRAMYESIDREDDSIIFKFSDSALYQEAHSLVLQDLINPATERIGRRYGLTEVKYYYEEHETVNKLVLYWFYE